MKDADILNVAGKYTYPESRASLLVEYKEDGIPMPTGETFVMTHWDFCTEELLAFAKDIIAQASE